MTRAPDFQSASTPKRTSDEESQVPLGLRNPLGAKTPLGAASSSLGSTASLIQFRRPLGARSLAVLNPSIFVSEASSPVADLIQPFNESAFFEPPQASAQPSLARELAREPGRFSTSESASKAASESTSEREEVASSTVVDPSVQRSPQTASEPMPGATTEATVQPSVPFDPLPLDPLQLPNDLLSAAEPASQASPDEVFAEAVPVSSPALAPSSTPTSLQTPSLGSRLGDAIAPHPSVEPPTPETQVAGTNKRELAASKMEEGTAPASMTPEPTLLDRSSASRANLQRKTISPNSSPPSSAQFSPSQFHTSQLSASQVPTPQVPTSPALTSRLQPWNAESTPLEPLSFDVETPNDTPEQVALTPATPSEIAAPSVSPEPPEVQLVLLSPEEPSNSSPSSDSGAGQPPQAAQSISTERSGDRPGEILHSNVVGSSVEHSVQPSFEALTIATSQPPATAIAEQTLSRSTFPSSTTSKPTPSEATPLQPITPNDPSEEAPAIQQTSALPLDPPTPEPSPISSSYSGNAASLIDPSQPSEQPSAPPAQIQRQADTALPELPSTDRASTEQARASQSTGHPLPTPLSPQRNEPQKNEAQKNQSQHDESVQTASASEISEVSVYPENNSYIARSIDLTTSLEPANSETASRPENLGSPSLLQRPVIPAQPSTPAPPASVPPQPLQLQSQQESSQPQDLRSHDNPTQNRPTGSSQAAKIETRELTPAVQASPSEIELEEEPEKETQVAASPNAAEIPQLPRVLQDLSIFSPLATASTDLISSVRPTSPDYYASDWETHNSQAISQTPSQEADAIPTGSSPFSSPSISSSRPAIQRSIDSLPPLPLPNNTPTRTYEPNASAPSSSAPPSRATSSSASSSPTFAASISPAPLPSPSSPKPAAPSLIGTLTEWSSIEELLVHSNPSSPDVQASPASSTSTPLTPAPSPTFNSSTTAPPAASTSAITAAQPSNALPAPRSSVRAEARSPTEAFPDLRPFEPVQHHASPVIQRQTEAAIAPEFQTALPANVSAQPEAESNERAASSDGDNDALEKLAQAIYLQLRQRLAIERERSGQSSPGRLPW